jgi:hypothetical protein
VHHTAALIQQRRRAKGIEARTNAAAGSRRKRIRSGAFWRWMTDWPASAGWPGASDAALGGMRSVRRLLRLGLQLNWREIGL